MKLDCSDAVSVSSCFVKLAFWRSLGLTVPANEKRARKERSPWQRHRRRKSCHSCRRQQTVVTHSSTSTWSSAHSAAAHRTVYTRPGDSHEQTVPLSGEPGHLRRLTVEWGARRIRKPVARDARFQHPRCEIRELQALGLRAWPPHRARREAVQLQNGRRRPRVHVLTRFHRRRLVHRLMLRYGSLRLCLRIEQRHHQPRSVRILTQLRARLAPPRSGAVESRRACP